MASVILELEATVEAAAGGRAVEVDGISVGGGTSSSKGSRSQHRTKAEMEEEQLRGAHYSTEK